MCVCVISASPVSGRSGGGRPTVAAQHDTGLLFCSHSAFPLGHIYIFF